MKRQREDSCGSSTRAAEDSPLPQSTAASTPPPLGVTECNAQLIKTRILETHNVISAYAALQQHCNALEAQLAKHAHISEQPIKRKSQPERDQAARIKHLEGQLAGHKRVDGSLGAARQIERLTQKCSVLQGQMHAKDFELELLRAQVAAHDRAASASAALQVPPAPVADIFELYDLNLDLPFDMEQGLSNPTGESVQ